MESKTERKPRDYGNGKIYCIRNYINDKIYIGSTCQSLSKRMAYHRQDCMKSNRHNTLIYKMMFDLGRDNFYIELLEECPCDNLNQLTRREGELIRELKSSLNHVVAGRTVEEYKVECADKIKKSKAISDRKYADKNGAKIKEYQSEYYQKNRERILENVSKNREEQKEIIKQRNKEHYQRNREKILERVKAYRDNNREKILPKQREYNQKKKLQKSQVDIEDMD